MHTLSLLWDSAWKVALVSIVLGAGLPALFAIGVRGLAIGNGHESADGAVHRPNPLGNIVAGIAFLIVIVAIFLGLAVIVSKGFGYEMGFEPFPTFHKK